jgi:hypothetical protein
MEKDQNINSENQDNEPKEVDLEDQSGEDKNENSEK